MITFADLKATTEHAEKSVTLAAKSKADIEALLVGANTEYTRAVQAKIDAHQAMHDWLVERGATSLVSADGAILVYLASDQPPGWYTVQPIPGSDVKVK